MTSHRETMRDIDIDGHHSENGQERWITSVETLIP